MAFPRDHTKWNFDALQEFVEGPLLNPKRLEEAIKIMKFVRGFLKFFHPFEHRFSDMKRMVCFTLVLICGSLTYSFSGKLPLGTAGLLLYDYSYVKSGWRQGTFIRGQLFGTDQEEFCSIRPRQFPSFQNITFVYS
jgi:hypothetical protein